MNDNELVSLTDLHRFAGQSASRHPSLWVRSDEVEAFVQAVAKKFKYTKSYVLVPKAGRNGGTWAHWQIALAYAQWLSPELHMACNEVFKQFMEADASLAVSVLERTKVNDTVKTQINHF